MKEETKSSQLLNHKSLNKLRAQVREVSCTEKLRTQIGSLEFFHTINATLSAFSIPQKRKYNLITLAHILLHKPTIHLYDFVYFYSYFVFCNLASCSMDFYLFACTVLST